MIKAAIAQVFQDALARAGADWGLVPASNGGGNTGILDNLKLERPRNAEHGDYAVNVSPLSKLARLAPPQIADRLAAETPDTGAALSLNVIGGFLNYRVGDPLLAQALVSQLATPSPGAASVMANDTILLEYVSANPTGPLHVGHGRWAALGDSLVRIWRHCGATVTPEFYINDAGVQMANITASVALRAAELLETGVRFPEPVEGEPFPYYPGDYVIPVAQAFLAAHPDHTTVLRAWNGHFGTLPDATARALKAFTREYQLSGQKALLERIGVQFEAWFSEQEYLHDRGLVVDVLERLRSSGFTYEQEGALWLQSSEFGDEKDRVLVKSDGSYTYLAADIAYHDHKFSRVDDDGRPQYNRIVNIWGADHHGYMARMRAAIQALGHNPDTFEILLGQLVNLIVEGERTRMGKRRRMLTLEDVVEEVGVDALRFWMVSKSADTTLDFDVALAASQTDENPVFYVQYAHARCAGILRNAFQPQLNVDTGETVPPPLEALAFEEFLAFVTPEDLAPLFSSLEASDKAEDKTRQLLKTLILRLDGFTELVQDAARLRAPHLLARYSLDLAAEFHAFYNACRILTPDLPTTRARLAVVVAVRKVLAQALALLGVSAPDRM